MVSAENQRAGVDRGRQRHGYTRPPLHDFFMTRYTEAYANEISAFIDAVESNLRPLRAARRPDRPGTGRCRRQIRAEKRAIKVSEVTGALADKSFPASGQRPPSRGRKPW